MKSRITKRFRKGFSALPEEVRDQAKRAYRKFRQDTWHQSLRFKQVHPTIPIYSARVAKGYRAVGQRTENGMVWFWIGSHSDYDKLLSQYRSWPNKSLHLTAIPLRSIEAGELSRYV